MASIQAVQQSRGLLLSAGVSARLRAVCRRHGRQCSLQMRLVNPGSRGKGELSRRAIDREWQHQVALPEALVALPEAHYIGHNYRTLHYFAERLSLCPRTISFRRDDTWHVVFASQSAIMPSSSHHGSAAS